MAFHGWRGCYQLSNGLVCVTSVPQIGGRALEYALGRYNFLFLGRGELGETCDDGDERRYRHFGGQFAQLHPEIKWTRAQGGYPPSLFMGKYEARIVPAENGAAAIELVSPVDLATGTRLARRVELFPGTTRLRITDTLANVRPVPQEWGIQAMLQLKGFPARDGILSGEEKPQGQMGLYVPLNPRSRYRGGVSLASSERKGGNRSQWSTTALPGLLALRYRGEFDKATLDPVEPWVAFADHASEHVLVQQCAVPDKAVLTAGRPLVPYPFIEVQCLGKVERLEPGQTTAVVQEWLAARCPGPVVDVTPAGVVAAPLSLLRGQGGYSVAARCGVFHVGRAAVVFRGGDGAELARVDCGPVTPLAPLELKRPVTLPSGTAQVELEVLNAEGVRIGNLGRIDFGSEGVK